LRTKGPNNPYFASNPAATAMMSTALSSSFSVHASVTVAPQLSLKGLLSR